MRAAWYERQGDPAEVLEIGEMATSAPAAGEVAVRLTRSGINPGDLKKRSPGLSNPMAFPRIVPHSDGAGVVEAVGDGVHPSRIGRRVWVYGAQSYRAFGTAADGTVVPDRLAVDLPDEVGDEIGASLGIPGITAHRAVFADGPVRDQVVLVHGVRGGVSSLAAQLARWAGAQVIGTVRTAAEIGLVDPATAEHVVALDADPEQEILRLASGPIMRIVEVAFSANVDLDAAVAANGAVIASYATKDGRPTFPFWPMLFDNLTIRLLGSDDFPAEAKDEAARDLSRAAADGALSIPIAEVIPLDQIVRAHQLLETGHPAGRVLLSI